MSKFQQTRVLISCGFLVQRCRDEAREKNFGGGITSKSMIIKAKEVKHMWLPDTYIGNSKVVETPAKDSSTSFIIIRSVGQQCTVEYTLR
ncbi:uncharacterized protein CEXT_256871 [Caerostris extrusa]|uniref:Uncharacterized protein n=1 Tax=Caerostris extrusa TaxID=172846 RepID=A0AAV4XCJ2_CAEEX|nr:uncharacterized protein CEXT_256871 [Caerostris extrusa]